MEDGGQNAACRDKELIAVADLLVQGAIPRTKGTIQMVSLPHHLLKEIHAVDGQGTRYSSCRLAAWTL